jgi:hypothetical protein
VSRFVDRCRFNAGVANAPRRRRWPFRTPAGLPGPSGWSKGEEHSLKKQPSLPRAGKEVPCRFRPTSTIFRKLGPNATKERAGVVLDHPNSPRVTRVISILLISPPKVVYAEFVCVKDTPLFFSKLISESPCTYLEYLLGFPI